MARPLRVQREGAIWHITSRGVEKRPIYLDDNDCATFLEFLGETVVEARWRLHAYVLMTNHYHLLLETPERTLSEGMKTLNERWAERFNWRHSRVGHLFQGRFDGKLVDDEKHLFELFRYVVLNPVRGGMVEHAEEYAWSSYRATAGLAQQPPWLEIDSTLSRFHEDQRSARVLYRQFVAAGRGVRPRPWEPAAIITAVSVSFDETEDTLRERGSRMCRKAFAQLARENSRMTLREIGAVLDVNLTAAAKLAAAGLSLECTDTQYRAALTRARAHLGVIGV